jgi:peptide-methionine (S)-S-oxide reductase
VNRRALLALVTAALFTVSCGQPALAEGTMATPEAAVPAREAAGLKTAIFAGGCFWGVEAVFSHVKGVTSVVSGYHGGSAATANYDRVGRGDTGHAEAVRVTYDPQVVRYDQLLRVFFAVATDPTQLNRQGPDVGTQYRNAVVPMNREQTRVLAGYLAQLGVLDLWHRPLVTRTETYRRFYPAEDYHQDFAHRNPNHGYIRRWDAPKVAALKQMFPGLWKERFTTG